MAERPRDLGISPEGNVHQLLDWVEGTFRAFLAEREKRLGEAAPSIETTRYGWDVVNIRFLWTGPDGINRNLNVYLAGFEGHAEEQHVPVVFPTQGTYNELVIEANAWRDIEQPDGSETRSFWGEVLSRLQPPIQTMQLRESLQRAHETVSSWKVDDLRKQTTLQPLAKY